MFSIITVQFCINPLLLSIVNGFLEISFYGMMKISNKLKNV